MTRLDSLRAAAVPWWVVEAARFESEIEHFTAAGFDVTWVAEGGGFVSGRLPMWPFDRPQPDGVEKLLGGSGLLFDLCFGQAFPMVMPSVVPRDPVPEIGERTLHRWHVNGDGSLCLLQSADAWRPETPATDLLVKAAAWRVEYALVKAGVVEAMSLTGIVSDDSRDGLIAAAVDVQRAGSSGGFVEASE